MALSRIVYPGDGVTVQFAIPFALGYLKQSDVQCRVGNEVDGGGDPLYRTLTFDTDTLVTVSGTPAPIGQDVVFTRTVDAENLLVDFEDSSILNEANLNASQKQMIMLVHQVLDGRFDTFQTDLNMANHRVINLADPVDDQDAATKAYVLSTSPTSGAAADAGAAAGEAAAAAAAEAVLTSKLDKGQNLSDVASVGLARANLGLGSIATQDLTSIYATGGELVNVTLTQPTLVLKQSPIPANTAEGSAEWGTTYKVLSIGAGGSSRLILPAPAGVVAGDLFYASAPTILTRLPKGTTRQALQMNAGATAPEWATPAMVLLNSAKLASATSAITMALPGGFPAYELRLFNILNTTDAIWLQLELSTNGGTSGLAAGSYAFSSAATSGAQSNAGADAIDLANEGDNNSIRHGQSIISIGGADDSSIVTTVLAHTSYTTEQATTHQYHMHTAGRDRTARQINGVRIKYSAGNIAAGARWALYGMNGTV